MIFILFENQLGLIYFVLLWYIVYILLTNIIELNFYLLWFHTNGTVYRETTKQI